MESLLELNIIVQALFLAAANKMLVDYLSEPVRQRFEMDMWWLRYVALVTGALIGWFAGINIFPVIENVMLARLLSSLFVGGGSSLIHDLFSQFVTDDLIDVKETEVK